MLQNDPSFFSFSFFFVCQGGYVCTSMLQNDPFFFLSFFCQGGYVFGSLGLSVCLFVCGRHHSKSYERIGMKSYGEVVGSTMKN